MAKQLEIISRMLAIVGKLKVPGRYMPTDELVDAVNRSMASHHRT